MHLRICTKECRSRSRSLRRATSRSWSTPNPLTKDADLHLFARSASMTLHICMENNLELEFTVRSTSLLETPRKQSIHNLIKERGVRP